jgi:hypothetical protein
MIVVALKGGLGNQLFQYALGRKLAMAHGAELVLDTSALDSERPHGDTCRPFTLGGFRIAARIATPEETRRLKRPFGFASKAWRTFSTKVLRRHHIGFEPSVLRMRGDAYLDGYWQSYKYFEDIRDALLAELTLKELSPAASAMLARIAAEPAAVAIHVRRGDYAASAPANRTHGTCSPEYYRRAIASIKERAPGAAWFVFSDDPAWVREHISFPSEPVFVSGNGLGDAEELALMAVCKHAVIANSTFSWWGAWLNRNPEKIVVAPRPWSNTGKPSLADIIPPSWILLPRD